MRTKSRNPGIVRPLVYTMLLPVSLFWPKFELLAQQPPPSVVARGVSGGNVTTILGRDVVDAAGEDVGPLIDILVDKTGQPIAGVIDVGGFLGLGTRRIAVAWRLLRFVSDRDASRIRLDLTVDSVAAAPEFQRPDGSLIVIDNAAP